MLAPTGDDATSGDPLAVGDTSGDVDKRANGEDLVSPALEGEVPGDRAELLSLLVSRISRSLIDIVSVLAVTTELVAESP